MELLYIWIEDYKNIKEQGFNFSSKHRFEFIPQKDKDDKIIGGELRHEENPNHIENFFGENITNVTAIIGENGAGKSTLLEFLLLMKLGTLYYGYSDNYLFIYVIKREGKIYVSSLTKIESFDVKYEQDAKIHHLPFIYYNNLFHSIDLFILFETKRISHTSLNKIQIESIDSDIMYFGKQGFRKFYQNYTNQELKQQIDFLSSFNLKDNFFNSLILSISYSEKKENYTNLTWLIELCEKEKISSKFYLVANWQIKFLIDFFPQLYNLDFFKEEITFQSLKNKIENALNTLNTTSTIDFFKELNVLFKDIDVNDIKKSSICLSVKNQNHLKLIDKIFKFNYNHDCFYYNWLHGDQKQFQLSYGEKSFLNIYSRLHSTIEKLKNELNILLILDEGELGFHPQWQKEYLKILIDFLPQIFPDKKIQIILTSHSPFLVSDLPKENIIFLSKNAKGECVVSKLQDRKETFGANIHTLFTDSFFMKGGLMGTFAEKRINEVIAYLNGENLDGSLFNGKTQKDQQDLAQKYISMIGEPIIKNMLQKQLNTKRLEKVESHEERIKKLEEELEKLKKDKK